MDENDMSFLSEENGFYIPTEDSSSALPNTSEWNQNERVEQTFTGSLCLPSTDDACLLIESNDPEIASVLSSDRKYKRMIAEWVASHKNQISGNASEWHNLVNPYFVCDDYASALIIAQSGLERFPNDATLIGDIVRCAGQLGDWEIGDKYIEKACQEDYRSGEDWSLPVYVCEYLISKARAQNAEQREITYEKALSFLDAAMERLSATDRLLCEKADVLLEAKRFTEARDLLEDAIIVEEYDHGGTKTNRIPVPQCCIKYLDSVLGDSCDYDTIIKICDAGIRFSAREFRSANVGYFCLKKALAMDAKIVASSAEREGRGVSQEYVRTVLRNYALASKLNSAKSYRDICRERFIILSMLFSIDDMNVDDYILSEAD